MSHITITINNRQISCVEGESILQIARKEGIEIPAICYLSGCSPTMACKLCMIEADGKRSYSCNTKAKDGMNILTHTPEINQERTAIMQSYNVNHPLQCGVCDKSGECELQNYTLKMNVTSQDYHIKESEKLHKSWAKVVYDPNLCIMCERCVTTCKDNLGEGNLKAQKADLEPLDSAKWKDKMPKDALSVWGRKQKALISFVGDAPCFDCGECVSVCPVGALSTNDFKYKANAWELQKIESTCTHCPMGCKIIYETRHLDSQGTPHIYRVKNDFYFNPICGAGRYAYDITSSYQPVQNLQNAIKAFKQAKSINVGNDTTNEEAFVLNHLAKTLNLTLHNQEAFKFQSFVGAFLHFAKSKSLAHLDHLKAASSVIVLGGAINNHTPTLRYMLNNKLKILKGSQVVYMHPIRNSLIQSLSKNLTQIAYHPDSLSTALGSIALASYEELPATLQVYLEPITQSLATHTKTITKDIKKNIQDTSETGEIITREVIEKVEESVQESIYQALIDAQISNENLEILKTALKQPDPVLLVGPDVYEHPQAHIFAQILGILSLEQKIKVLLIPPFANALGIATICDLSAEKIDGYSIGFRSKGDFILDSDYVAQNSTQSSHKPDFILPAINQIEGTYTNIDSRILPLKPALPFDGYDLSDIAQSFGMKGNYLIDYTSLICGCNFDDFQNHFLNDGTNMRGYRLKDFSSIAISPSYEQISPLEVQKPQASYNAYMLSSPSQFNAYTALSKNLQNKSGIYASPSLLQELNLSEGQIITLTNSTHSLSGAIYIDYHLEDSYFLIDPLLQGARAIFATNHYTSLKLIPHTRSENE